MKNALSITCAALLLGGLVESRAELKCSAKFDINSNGTVEIGKEIDICILHQTSSVHRTFDRNLNGVIDGNELADLEAGVRKSADFVTLSVDTADELGSRRGIKPQAAAKPEPPSKDRFNTKSGILLRNAYQAPSVILAPTENLAKVAGASFTFSHDRLTDNYTASGTGALMVYGHWDLNGLSGFNSEQPPGAGNFLTGAAAHVGIEFDRKVNRSNPSRDINSLVFKAGGEAEFGGPYWSHYIRADLFDSSDFELNSHVIGGSLEYEPVSLDLGIGVARQIGGLPLYYRWRPVAHIEYQHVADTGGSAVLESQPDIAFGGPVITGELYLGGALERLFFNATYWQMFDLGGDIPDFHYFEVGANWGLDEKGHLALTAKYRTGNLPKTRQSVDDITIGLTAKF
ncbi:hypothetical protein DFR52_101503 [Hoeflea marina]|uniref:Uncharacterized protein n=1 Tax=Hoeflea marina TaxID=274592 RepID=A0A317PSS9_9HYPH|nr:hypothetical protein [Hoeflea marina]PWW03815.1 hypothetical protein DFR52_101503 [Hoeflea marina]